MGTPLHTRLPRKYNKLNLILLCMELNFSNVIRLKALRVDKSKLLEKESILSKPLLTNRSLIKNIHKEFESYLCGEDSKHGGSNVYRRKMFIFIILYLYAPSTFVGDKIPSGLRSELANVLGLSSACLISIETNRLMFLYQNYRDFKDKIDSLFPKLMGSIVSAEKNTTI